MFGPAIHFLTSELPIEAQIHWDIFSLFHSIWSNPNSKIYHIVKYLLEMSPGNSRTWSAHIRRLSQMYQMEDPLSCIRRDPPTKSIYKEYVLTKISSFHETELRNMAYENSCMKYFNVSIFGLRGRIHPAIRNINNTNEVVNMRPHLKMLIGDYLTYEKKSHQSGGSPECRICYLNETDSYMHILLFCDSLSEPRQRILTQIITFCQSNNVNIELYLTLLAPVGGG